MRLNTRKKLLLLFAAASLVLVGGAYAYTVMTISGTVNVQEPLTISNAAITDTSSASPGNCTTSGSTMACSLSIYAGESGAITFTVSNAASVAISAVITATSSDKKNVPVAISPSGPWNLAASGSLSMSISFTVSQSTPPESVTITVTVGR